MRIWEISVRSDTGKIIRTEITAESVQYARELADLTWPNRVVRIPKEVKRDDAKL